LTLTLPVCPLSLSPGHVIKADYVVNCAGMWARQLGELNGVNIPNQAAEHYYVITEPMKDIDPNWPVVEDPSSYTYIRPEGGGLMVRTPTLILLSLSSE
jgi:glycine/D-amino acid oxidase-like deaminating enzyme